MTARLSNCRRLVIKIGSALLVDAKTGAVRSDWLSSLIADLVLSKGRHLHKPGDRTVGGDGVIDIGSRGFELTDQALDGGGREALAGHIRTDFAGEFLKGEVSQQKRPLGSQGEAGHANAL